VLNALNFPLRIAYLQLTNFAFIFIPQITNTRNESRDNTAKPSDIKSMKYTFSGQLYGFIKVINTIKMCMVFVFQYFYDVFVFLKNLVLCSIWLKLLRNIWDGSDIKYNHKQSISSSFLSYYVIFLSCLVLCHCNAIYHEVLTIAKPLACPGNWILFLTLLELINKFSKLAGSKINIEKLVALLTTNYLKKKVRKQSHL
jgi:hypothetical protein